MNYQNLSITELQKINKEVVRILKEKMTDESLKNRSKFFVGEIVGVNHKRFTNKTFTIQKIKMTKCDITGAAGSFTVPMGMLKKIA